MCTVSAAGAREYPQLSIYTARGDIAAQFSGDPPARRRRRAHTPHYTFYRNPQVNAMYPSRSPRRHDGACERAGTMARYTLALLCVGLAAVCADADKRAEMSPVPFVLGSRYGRSPPRMLAPRNDRFFMGSRYGKRSEPDSDAQTPGSLAQLGLALGQGGPGSVAGGLVTLQCDYTGLGQLYRCRPARRTMTDIRNDEEPSAPEEE